MRAFWPDPKVIVEERHAVLDSVLWVTGVEPHASPAPL